MSEAPTAAAPTRAELIKAADRVCATAFSSLVFPDNATARTALRDRLAARFVEETKERRSWAEAIVDEFAPGIG